MALVIKVCSFRMCVTDVAILFLTLASVIIKRVSELFFEAL